MKLFRSTILTLALSSCLAVTGAHAKSKEKMENPMVGGAPMYAN